MGPGLRRIGFSEWFNLTRMIFSRQLSRYRFSSPGRSFVSKFESIIKEKMETPFAVGMNSCTSALLCSLKALGIGPGDEVLVPGYTFIATISAIVNTGAKPVICEIDSSLTLDPEEILLKSTEKTKAIVAVHMLGTQCDMDRIINYANKKNIYVIEDVAQAFGGKYKGKYLGTFGEAGCFSLNVYKTITAGDGGLLITNNSDIYNTAFALHDHGFYPMKERLIDENSIFGLNLRMHEPTGAIAFGQIKKLDKLLSDLKIKKTTLQRLINLDSTVNFHKPNDEDGDCSTLLILQFKDEERAVKFSSLLKTSVLSTSSKHNSRYLSSSMRDKISCNKDDVSMLEKSNSILNRSVAISIGVTDSYLGAGFGISIDSSVAEVNRVAKKINTALQETI